jgi:hypothetical protein
MSNSKSTMHLHSQTRTTKQIEINTNIAIQNINGTRFVSPKFGSPCESYVFIEEAMSDHSEEHSSRVSFNYSP